MSWDIFVQQIPAGAARVRDIPKSFVPAPLGARAEIVAAIKDVFPTVDFSDPLWGVVEQGGFTIEIDIGAKDPVISFALHVRGAGSADAAVAALLNRLGCRALDPQAPTGIFDVDSSTHSLEIFGKYRDEVIEPHPRPLHDE